jgi:hypothetical protein
MKTASLVLMTTAIAIAPISSARAEDPMLHHAHSGALLAYADAEVQVLYNTFLAKEFDPELAKTTLKELERTVNTAKRSVDRTRLMLGDDSKLEPEFAKLIDVLKRAEKQLSNLNTDVEEQTGEKEEGEPSDHRGDDAPKDEAPKLDWNLLKNGASWLYADIKEARAMHATVGKKLKGSALKPPPKPAGKREE